MKFEYLSTNMENSIVIRIEGLSRTTTLLHVTDSHINATDASEGSDTWAQSYSNYNFDELETRHHFERTLAFAAKRAVDAVALTGDIVNGATAGNLSYLEQELARLQAPVLYTPGNHDWEYPGEIWGEATRKAHVGKFSRISNGDPGFRVMEMNGILLIAIDNSTYQISQSQLDKFRTELERGLPVLLFMHIPIYLPSLLQDVLKTWHAPIMLNAEGWDAERMASWMVEPASPATRDFHRLLLDNPGNRLVGIFCGHVHFPHQDEFGLGGSRQFVTQPGFLGGYRMIRLLPGN